MDNNIFNIKENSLSYGRGYVYSLQEYLPPNSRYILCRYSGNSGNRETV